MRAGRSRRCGDRGQAALELIGMLPVLILGGLLVLQAGTAIWALSSTNEAARAAARAYSLDPDAGVAAARVVAAESLPGALEVKDIEDAGRGGYGIRLTVEIPKILPLPLEPITREVVMP
jgi:TadE-like protein